MSDLAVLRSRKRPFHEESRSNLLRLFLFQISAINDVANSLNVSANERF